MAVTRMMPWTSWSASQMLARLRLCIPSLLQTCVKAVWSRQELDRDAAQNVQGSPSGGRGGSPEEPSAGAPSTMLSLA
eukprot:CAMPEP_0206522622 /NCGR_PEP_ID=MMETSP0324_2-20121206/67091_1 /ASSEMBLY_ACC=CAM_ASM_000836 /TAXON_ID=2866 /ORGANISM="Crypthecodinium cohnii, Strain Seligo" /LENGTH=77 /DNA_ID=CAMNT_0054016819 /DNA_START=822 /DNA_END=1052 /DNA_ORIENTATION=+